MKQVPHAQIQPGRVFYRPNWGGTLYVIWRRLGTDSRAAVIYLKYDAQTGEYLGQGQCQARKLPVERAATSAEIELIRRMLA